MRICAALYMIMANRYDWQMFIEATGDGGSGKSTFTHIASLLAGKQNTVSAEMTALDDAGGRAQVVGSRLIVPLTSRNIQAKERASRKSRAATPWKLTRNMKSVSRR